MTERRYTPGQQRVIEHAGGHAVVAAMAGSGNTETLIGWVRHLLCDVQPSQIVEVMFHFDAREAFQRRFEDAVNTSSLEIRPSHRPWCSVG